jgi:HEAT repeat protein
VTKAKQALESARACQANDPRIGKLAKALEQAARGEVAEQTEVEEKQPRGPDIVTVHAKLSGGPEVRRAGAREMVSFGAEAVKYLLPMLNTDADIGVRTAVAKALGAIGAPAASACTHLGTEIEASAQRVVFPVDTGKKVSAADDMARVNREKELQAACREARARIGCR